MSALKDFQNRFGAEWIRLSNSEAFLAGLALANGEKLLKITQLSDAEIKQHSETILADLRGHMNYESGLLGLAEKKEFVFQQLPTEEYPDPAAEARDEERTDYSDQTTTGISSSVLVSVDPNTQFFPPQPKPKRGRPKGKKKK